MAYKKKYSAKDAAAAREAKIQKMDDYARTTSNLIIEQLEKGPEKWEQQWQTGFGSMDSRPTNAHTGKPYHGVNVLRLLLEQAAHGYSSGKWLTFNQAKDLGGHVKRGESGTICVHWSPCACAKRTETKTDENGNEKEEEETLFRMVPSFFTVFNVDQCEGLALKEKPLPEQQWTPVEIAERILKQSGADIRNAKQDEAYYSPSLDYIMLPMKEQFPDASAYYDTALHELGHWTGHESRLNREMKGGFGSESYAREELRAEISSMMVASQIGLPHNLGKHSAYINSWIKVLKDTPRGILSAAADASQISDMVLEFQHEKRRSYVVDFSTQHVSLMTQHEVWKVAEKVNPELWEQRVAKAKEACDTQEALDEARNDLAQQFLNPYRQEFTDCNQKTFGMVVTDDPAKAVEAARWVSPAFADAARYFVAGHAGEKAARSAFDRANQLAQTVEDYQHTAGQPLSREAFEFMNAVHCAGQSWRQVYEAVEAPDENLTTKFNR